MTAGRMTTERGTAGAWGGCAGRKAQALSTVEETPETRPGTYFDPIFKLAPADAPDKPSQFFCAAFGTADAAVLEARSGLSLAVLRLVSAVLAACQYRRPDANGEMQRHIAAGAVNGAHRALEAIAPGADLQAIPRLYLRALLSDLESGALLEGRALGAATRETLSQVAALHRSGTGDAAAFRAARRAAVQGTDAATADLDRAVLAFVESVAWPVDGLDQELHQFIYTLHFHLASALCSKQPTAEERRIRDVTDATYRPLLLEMSTDPSITWERVEERARQVPEVVASATPEFQARMTHLYCVACEQHAPRAFGGLLRVLGSA